MAAAMMFGAAAHADTRIGVTIYKYDDNFMSVVRKAIEKDAQASPTSPTMNDSQNDLWSSRTIRSTCCWPGDESAKRSGTVDPAAARWLSIRRANDIQWCSTTKNLPQALDSYDKAYYVGTDSKESGVIKAS
ncbi:hypothetical protein J4732_12595 [Serratia marcescens]|uniref:Uncharacterized protein n=1 Tax=Serratia marcescens TaxID=615 RepID=A0A939STH9_SERMA|nr:hypothetical protein [Serratia marcescens]